MVRLKLRDPPAGGVSLDQLRAAVAASRAADDPDDPHTVAWSFKVWAALWVTLSAPQQRVVYLVAFVGLNQDQAADDLGVSRGAVANTWRRALDRLRGRVPA